MLQVENNNSFPPFHREYLSTGNAQMSIWAAAHLCKKIAPALSPKSEKEITFYLSNDKIQQMQQWVLNSNHIRQIAGTAALQTHAKHNLTSDKRVAFSEVRSRF